MPSHYDLAFVVDVAHARFTGTETIATQVAAPTSRIVLNALDIEFQDVTIGTGAASQKAAVTLDAERADGDLDGADAAAEGPGRHSRALHRRPGNDQLRGFIWSNRRKRGIHAVTQFESTDARRAFPCFDEPSFKATFAVTLTIDRGDMAISNGKMLSDTPGPSITQHTVKFAPSPKMSSYLVAMAVGDFKCIEGGADNIPIRICSTPEKKGSAAGGARRLPQQVMKSSTTVTTPSNIRS